MTQAIAKTAPTPMAALTVAEQMQYAEMMSRASIVPQAYRGNPANILIAEGFGQSMGLTPAESLYRINVIQGKPTMSAELVAAQVRRAGHKLRIEQDPERMSATAVIVRCDDPDHPYRSTWDMERARKMGLAGKENYSRQPLTMLTWRAVTDCARMACSEAMFGMYTPDEMGAAVDSHGEAVEAPAQVVEVAPARRPEGTVVDLMPVTSLAAEFMEATGLDRRAANGAMCARAGVGKLAQLTSAQVEELAGWMREQIQAASQGGPDDDGEQFEPELLDEEEVF